MGFADLAGTAKHQGYVVKLAQVREPLYSLQPVETDGKAIAAQLAIENKSSNRAKGRVVQDDTDLEIPIGELATKPVHYFELHGLLYLSQHGFVVGLDTFLPAQPEVSKIPAVQVPPQNIQRDRSVCAHIIILLFATEAQQHGVRKSKLIL
jgi:hypothetical protein